MRIKGLGNEYNLIKKIRSMSTDFIGDDCAIIDNGKDYSLFTTDIMVEGNHFSLDYSKPYDLGIKAIATNVSDIAACGGVPSYCLVSLVLPKDTSVEFLEELYKGFRHACKKYNVKIIGGDTTSGEIVVINITMVGTAKKENLCRRSDAKLKDLILCTGPLGRSASGLNLFLKKKKHKLQRYYLRPEARLDDSRIISRFANAMIDVSDGLASEIQHICIQSKKGAVIYKDMIPIDKDTRKVAKELKNDCYRWALSGGEDYQLLFTMPRRTYLKNKSLHKYHILGEITKSGIYLVSNNIKGLIGKGYEHF